MIKIHWVSRGRCLPVRSRPRGPRIFVHSTIKKCTHVIVVICNLIACRLSIKIQYALYVSNWKIKRLKISRSVDQLVSSLLTKTSSLTPESIELCVCQFKIVFSMYSNELQFAWIILHLRVLNSVFTTGFNTIYSMSQYHSDTEVNLVEKLQLRSGGETFFFWIFACKSKQ